MFPFAATDDDAELTYEEWTVRRRRRRAGAAGAAAAVSMLGAAGPAQAMLTADGGGGGGTPKATPTPTPTPSPQVDPKPPVTRAVNPAPTKTASAPAPVNDSPYGDDHRQPAAQTRPEPKPDPKPTAPAPVNDSPYGDDHRQPAAQTRPEPKPDPKPAAPAPVNDSPYGDDHRQPAAQTRPEPKPDPKPTSAPQPAPTQRYADDHREPLPQPSPEPQASPKPPDAPPSTPANDDSPWVNQYLRTVTEPPKKPEPKPKVEVPAGTDPDLAQLLLPGNDVVVKPGTGDRGTPEPARDDAPVPSDEPSGTEPRDEGQPDSDSANPATPPRLGTQATPPRSDSPWVDVYLDSIKNPKPAPKPEPRPAVPDNMTPYELDQGITGPLLGPLYTPGQVEGARQRLDAPNGDLQGRIDELNDQYDDQNFIGPKTQQQQRELDNITGERTLREQQLALYSNGHCDYNCDVDAPYKKSGSLDDPFDAAAVELPDGATRAEVLTKAQEMAEQQRREAAEKPKEDEGPSAGHTALDVAGLAGPVGPFADGANTIWYAAEGDWGNAGFSLFGAIPIVGDAAKGAKLLKTGAKAVDKINDVDNAVDAARVASRDPSDLAKNYAENNLGGKFDMTDGSDDALAGIFGKTTSGVPTNAVRPGEFLPSQTRGYATELRALNELAARTDVKSIKAVPSAPGGRTPDFLVTKADGSVERVEVTTVTGAGSGYKPRGIGIADAPSKAQIKDALRRKTLTSSQFNSKLDGVDEGGSLVIGLRGGKDAGAEAGNAMADMTKRLADSKVREVTFTMGNGQTQRYVLDNGAYVRK